ncbi:MAG: BCD family MFS transporter [Erythrobacter sp.]
MRAGETLLVNWSRVAITWLPFADAASKDMPLPRLLRLALFQVSVGMATVLLNGTLNRVMIVELGIPAWLVALLIALPLLVAPLRVLMGHRSDTHRSAIGWKRVPYIWIGTTLQFGGLSIMPFALLLLSRPENFTLGIVASIAAFLLTGAGMHMTQTAGLALATDLAEPDKRPRAVALLYVMLLIGMMFAALVMGAMLRDFTPTRLVQVIQSAALLTAILNLIALWKQEGRSAAVISKETLRPAFKETWREFLARPHTARLLLAIGLGTAGFSMQDALLEPFGGEILGMSVGATTSLTGGWAFGALLGFMLAARLLGRNGNPLRMAGFGAVAGVSAFAMVMFAAPLDAPVLLYTAAITIGLGVGLFSVGTMVAAMGLASEGASGLALGAWGAVQASCAGIGIAMGGLIRDFATAFALADGLGATLADRSTGYGLVYSIEILLLLGTLVVLGPLVGRGHSGEFNGHSGRFGLQEFPT